MIHEENLSPIERLLGFAFVSDPRKAKFPIPKTPAKHPVDRPYPHPSMIITPEMARDVLKYRAVSMEVMPKELKHAAMTGNRRFLLTTLEGGRRDKGLIQKIKDGEWNPRISSPVVFTRDGFLLDGQHRFAACALAGVPIEMPPTTNGQWDTFSVLDTGRQRNAGQLLGNVLYADYSAATARMILAVIRREELREPVALDASNREIYDLVHSWPWFHESWDDGGSWMSHVMAASGRMLPRTPLAASTMMALAAGANPSWVQEFLNGLKPDYGDNLDEKFIQIGETGRDPRHMLKKFYLYPKAKLVPATLDKRRQTGHCRRAMEVWLEYKAGNPIELAKLPTAAPLNSDMPEVWHADAVRKFHQDVIAR